MQNYYSSAEFEEKFTYEGNDLGAVWSAEKTAFRLWSPFAEKAEVRLYKSGEAFADDLIGIIPMEKDIRGTWLAEKTGNLDGIYYTYSVIIDGKEAEGADPYARAAGANGLRSMVIDLSSTDPEGWEKDVPPYEDIEFPDAVLYEMHVRDLSSDESSGICRKGKFLGVSEGGTKTSAGISTGMDHIKELGITHIHFLPSYDFGSVDETKPLENQYNWGYDPMNYNIPEGSYSTDPKNGKTRIAEMKQMIKELHENKLGVVLDVVYNHVYKKDEFCFNKFVPGYFFRINEKGEYSNGSGCGNDTASERSMVRKFIVDSVKYWADEYHVDGFRFDISGLLDIRTLNEACAEVKKSHPHVIFYNEGWEMHPFMTKPDIPMADMSNSALMPDFAFFSDTIRDVIRGKDFSPNPGFVMGGEGLEKILESCFMGLPCWCSDPKQNLNYISCHDGYTLFDKIGVTLPEADFEKKVSINKLMAAINLLSQGVPFMQMGEEMLRTKPLPGGGVEHNSYNLPDYTNAIRWDDLEKPEYAGVFEYYKGLLAFRKAHGVFRMRSAEDVRSHITVIESGEKGLISFHLWGNINGESAQAIHCIFNASDEEKRIGLPVGKWGICIDGEKAGTEILRFAEDEITVPPVSAAIMIK